MAHGRMVHVVRHQGHGPCPKAYVPMAQCLMVYGRRWRREGHEGMGLLVLEGINGRAVPQVPLVRP